MATRYGCSLVSLFRNSSRTPFVRRLALRPSEVAWCGVTGTRRFSSAQPAQPAPKKETVTIHFVLPDGKRKPAKAKLGDSLLDVVIDNNLDIDGYGACEGTLACSTCHIIFKEENFKKIGAKATDEELDMLDLAFGLTDTSRLGCQIIVTKEMDGWEVTVPAGFADARS